jgi:hypothetical protein
MATQPTLYCHTGDDWTFSPALFVWINGVKTAFPTIYTVTAYQMCIIKGDRSALQVAAVSATATETGCTGTFAGANTTTVPSGTYRLVIQATLSTGGKQEFSDSTFEVVKGYIS